MKWLPALLLIFSVSAPASELWLKVGESRPLPASSEATVRIGARGVIRAVDTGDGLRVIGLKPGTTSLVVDQTSYLVRVSYSNQKDFALSFRAAVGKMMGLKFYTDQKQFVISGTLLRFSDWLRLAEIAKRSGGEYSFRAHPLPDVANIAMLHLRGLANKNGFPIVRFSSEGEFRVHIPKAAAGLKPAVERVFRPYGIGIEISGADLAIAPLIRVRVILAELSKSFSRDLGVKWPTEYKAQLLPQLKGDENLMVTLQALEARGQAQILASPTLLCRSGGQAKFHAGGEFPIRSFSRNSSNVTWKPHGVILNVKPKADFQGAMSIEVETEISLLDWAHTVDGVPSVKRNGVKSHFDLAGKRTIALSGLLRQDLGESKAGLPFLTGIPVLGALFSSQNFQNHQTELVIFVTPEIHSPDNDEPLQMPEGWVKMADSLALEVESILEKFQQVWSFDGRDFARPNSEEMLRQFITKTPADMHRRLENEFFQYGPLAAILHTPGLQEIIVNGPEDIWVESQGRFWKHEDRFLSETTFKNFVDRLCSEAGVKIDLTQPFSDGRWRDFRLHIGCAPLTHCAYHMNLRRLPANPWTLESLQEAGWAQPTRVTLLRQLIRDRKNILFIGPTGCGKTTVLGACLRELEENERAVIIEDTDELMRPNSASSKLLTRPTQSAVLPEITLTDLVRQSLRMRPSRLVMGEVRGAEAKDLLLALATGHSGSVGTLHASEPRQALLRLEMLVQLGAPQWNVQAIRQLIQLSVDTLVVCGNHDGKRCLEGIYKVAALESFGFLLEPMV